MDIKEYYKSPGSEGKRPNPGMEDRQVIKRDFSRLNSSDDQRVNAGFLNWFRLEERAENECALRLWRAGENVYYY